MNVADGFPNYRSSMSSNNHSMAAYRHGMDIAKERVRETDNSEIDPVEMAEEIEQEVEGSFPTDPLADFIQDFKSLK